MTPTIQLYYQQSLKSGPTNVAILRSRRVYILKIFLLILVALGIFTSISTNHSDYDRYYGV